MSTQVWAGSGLFAGTLVQVPIVPDSAHDRHALAQAVAQQTPCAQLPDMHSAPAEQNAPFGFRPHELPAHTLPDEQFASRVQAAEALAAVAGERDARDRRRARRTSRSRCRWTRACTCCSRSARRAQTVPGRCRRQPPAPSHFPSVPQVDAGWVAHILRGSSSPVGHRRARSRATSAARSFDRRRCRPGRSRRCRRSGCSRNRRAPCRAGRSSSCRSFRSGRRGPATQSSSLVQRLMHALSAHR